MKGRDDPQNAGRGHLGGQLARVSKLHDALPEKEIRYELKENPVAELYVAVKDEEVLGYIDFMITFDSATISRIAVNDLARRQGIGQALIDKMVAVCKRQKDPVSFITLEVRPSNTAALATLYKERVEASDD
jgi:ribosomal protein S18 acetylase RimI-like enzyme